jgi:hypothetical protein
VNGVEEDVEIEEEEIETHELEKAETDHHQASSI